MVDKAKFIKKHKKRRDLATVVELRNLVYRVRLAENTSKIENSKPKLSKEQVDMLIKHVIKQDKLLNELISHIKKPDIIGFSLKFDHAIQNYWVYMDAVFENIDIVHVRYKDPDAYYLTYIFDGNGAFELKHPPVGSEDRLIPYCNIDEKNRVIYVNYV
jgi:hypothetical protein